MCALSAVLAVSDSGRSIVRTSAVPGSPIVTGSAPVPPDAAAPETPRLPPLRLIIPRIGVDAAVEQVGVDGSGRMDVPARPDDVAWYAPGPAPGESGDAVMDGHLDWYDAPRAVFADLHELRPGDRVDVLNASDRLRFVVTAVDRVAYTARPAGLFDATGGARLSLITCAGSWDSAHGTYAERLVITARSLGPVR